MQTEDYPIQFFCGYSPNPPLKQRRFSSTPRNRRSTNRPGHDSTGNHQRRKASLVNQSVCRSAVCYREYRPRGLWLCTLFTGTILRVSSLRQSWSIQEANDAIFPAVRESGLCFLAVLDWHAEPISTDYTGSAFK